jgi:hypothetical protein
MSLNVFIAICVLACDFMIYAFFQWTFGDKHREFRRHLPKTAHRPSPAPFPKSKQRALDFAAPRPRLAAAPKRHRHTEREVA